MTIYEFRDGSGYTEEHLSTPATVRADLEAWIREGSWGSDGSPDSTIWIHASYSAIDDEDADDVVVAIDPDEPACLDGDEHDWQSPHELVRGIVENPGVWGSGGGVVIHEACLRCGCGRTTDTWAQDPSTGVQGLTSVAYEPGRYADELVPVEVTRAAAEVDGTYLCDEGREAAGYVLLACRGEGVRVEQHAMSAIRPALLGRLGEACDYLEGVWQRVDRADEARALRLALRLAAQDEDEERVARAVAAVLDTPRGAR